MVPILKKFATEQQNMKFKYDHFILISSQQTSLNKSKKCVLGGGRIYWPQS